MRSTIAILSLVASIVAEAPYHLPRPSLPFPPAAQPPPSYHHHHHHQAPLPPPPVQYQQPQQVYQQPQQVYQPAPQQYAQNGGYQYQQPSIQPTFVQPAPRPQYQVPQAQLPIQTQPRPVYQAPAPIQYQPQPQPIYQQPIPQPQPQYFQPPSTSYGVPQFRPQPQPIQIQPQPILTYSAPQPQPRPQIQPQQVYQPVQQFSQQQGYNYQQPQIQFSQQSFTRNPVTTSLSSYQADSNQYNGAQALDSVVVDQVQNIIKESEHTSARDSGYLSLVSGVSLENAQPSIEVSSFTHTAPLNIGASLRQSSSVSAPSSDYGTPSVSSFSQSEQSSVSFLPEPKPATGYGVPNKK